VSGSRTGCGCVWSGLCTGLVGGASVTEKVAREVA